MSSLGKSNGRDISIVVITGDGSQLRLGDILDFKTKQETTKERIKPINGINTEIAHFDGWTGSIDISRMSGALDAYFAQQEANYYNGISGSPCSMQVTIREPNGSVSQYSYLNGTLTFDNAGDWVQDKSVSVVIGYFFGRRVTS